MVKYVMGLDISTSYVGISVLKVKQDGDYKEVKMVASDVVKLKKARFDKIKDDVEKLWAKVDYTIEKIVEYIAKFYIDDVGVEGILKQHGKGTSATTLTTLAYFNGMITARVRLFCNNVTAYNPTVAKNLAGCTLKVRKKFQDDIKDKDQNKRAVVRYIKSLFPKDFIFNYTPKGNMEGGTFDRADATIVAMAKIKEI